MRHFICFSQVNSAFQFYLNSPPTPTFLFFFLLFLPFFFPFFPPPPLLYAWQSFSWTFPALTYFTDQVDFFSSPTSLEGLRKEETEKMTQFTLKSLASLRLIGEKWAKAAVRGWTHPALLACKERWRKLGILVVLLIYVETS